MTEETLKPFICSNTAHIDIPDIQKRFIEAARDYAKTFIENDKWHTFSFDFRIKDDGYFTYSNESIIPERTLKCPLCTSENVEIRCNNCGLQDEYPDAIEAWNRRV